MASRPVRARAHKGSSATTGKSRKFFDHALSLFNRGQDSASRELARKIVARDPHHRDARQLLAMIAFRNGKTETALQQLQVLEAEFPNHAPILNELGTALIESERFEEAVAVLMRAAHLSPENAGFRLNLAIAYERSGLLDEAERHIRSAIYHQHDYPDAYRALAEILTQDGRTGEAVTAAQWAVRQAPADPRSFICLADAYNANDDVSGARAAYERAIALDAGDPAAEAKYQQFLIARGFFDDAAQSARRLLERYPDAPGPLLALAQVTVFVQHDDLIARMEAALGRMDENAEGRAHLHFGLAKAYEDLKDYPRAFEHARRGNALTRQSRHYAAEETRATFETLQSAITPALLSQLDDSGFSDDTPIFVIGMPRSGTTLTEQILSSHEKVHGAGELKLFDMLVRQLRNRLNARDDAELIAAASPEDWRLLGETYVTRLRRRAPEARHIVDKMPGNFRHLGFIRLALPKAKVVYCQRAAPDTCVSIFNLRFAATEMGYGYELGAYYRMHAALMRHWQAVMPGFFFTNVYEDLVADQAAQTRRLLDFCGLGWNDNVLDFFANGRAVDTASRTQIRQPIYTSSVGRYRRYGSQLQPLLDALHWNEEKGEIQL